MKKFFVGILVAVMFLVTAAFVPEDARVGEQDIRSIAPSEVFGMGVLRAKMWSLDPLRILVNGGIWEVDQDAEFAYLAFESSSPSWDLPEEDSAFERLEDVLILTQPQKGEICVLGGYDTSNLGNPLDLQGTYVTASLVPVCSGYGFYLGEIFYNVGDLVTSTDFDSTPETISGYFYYGEGLALVTSEPIRLLGALEYYEGIRSDNPSADSDVEACVRLNWTWAVIGASVGEVEKYCGTMPLMHKYLATAHVMHSLDLVVVDFGVYYDSNSDSDYLGMHLPNVPTTYGTTTVVPYPGYFEVYHYLDGDIRCEVVRSDNGTVGLFTIDQFEKIYGEKAYTR